MRIFTQLPKDLAQTTLELLLPTLVQSNRPVKCAQANSHGSPPGSVAEDSTDRSVALSPVDESHLERAEYSKERTQYAKESTRYAEERTQYAKESTQYAKERTQYAKKRLRLGQITLALGIFSSLVLIYRIGYESAYNIDMNYDSYLYECRIFDKENPNICIIPKATRNKRRAAAVYFMASINQVKKKNQNHKYINNYEQDFAFKFYKSIKRLTSTEPQPEIHLASASLNSCDFSGWDFTCTNNEQKSCAYLSEINFSRANLSGANFSSAELNNSIFFGADLSDTNFNFSKLINANIREALFDHKTSFKGADLTNADLSQTNISGAGFEGSILRNTDFSGSTLFSVSFDKNTDLDFAKLYNSKIDRINGLEQHHIDEACGDINTKIPKFLERPEHWTTEDSSSSNEDVGCPPQTIGEERINEPTLN